MKMPQRTDVAGVRRALGMVTYLANSCRICLTSAPAQTAGKIQFLMVVGRSAGKSLGGNSKAHY